MTSFYKRLIAQKLSRCIQGTRGKGLKQIENDIAKIIHVQALKRNVSKTGSQFALDITKLRQFSDRNSGNLTELEDDGQFEVFQDENWLNFRVNQGHFLKNVLGDIRTSSTGYGSLDNKCDKPENVCVEYSSPNVAKPFHVGHLRSTILGQVLANMYEAVGHSVKRVNFLGDWGTQFGLLSLGLVRYADVEQLKSDPLQELFNIYVKVNQEVKSECGKASEMTSPTYQEGMELFSRLEKGDEGMKALWKMVNDMNISELNKMYERLGVHFTHVLAESAYHEKTAQVLNRLKEAGLIQYGDDGVGYVQMEEEEVIGRASVVKSDGSSLYLTRDIATALERQEMFSLDRMHYVVEHGQRGHFVKLFHVLQKLGIPWACKPVDEVHVRFGRVMGMSTRQGKVVFLRDILDEARSRVIDSMTQRSTTRVSENLEEVGDIMGVTCIILQDLKCNRTSDYTFSWERTLNMKADSGIFVQYCHARLCSMLSGCEVALIDNIDVSTIQDDTNIQNLVLHMAKYPDVFAFALEKLEPHHIVQYLFKLCHLINAAYATCPVKGQNTDVAQARLLVFECSRQVVVNSMTVLGLKPLEEI